MTTEQNKALTRRFAALLNAHDADGAFALCSPDFVDHAMPPGTPAGTEGSRQFFKSQFAAFPDLHAEVYDITAEGDRVAFRVEVEGTHQGTLMGIPPTGRRVRLTIVNVDHFADGKITEHWGAMDTLGLMQQLGVVPPPRTA